MTQHTASRTPQLSFEFFPAATDAGMQKLLDAHQALRTLDPAYFSVTFGAGGSTQARTTEIVTALTQAESPDADLARFAEKAAAGAHSAITQYFYNPNAYFDFVERAERAGVTIPIVPGIMPILNYTQLARFSDACGAEIPRWIRLRLASFHDDVDSLRAFGHDVVVDLCQQLLDGGAPGIHFYTMNQAGPSTAIWQALGR